jgi:hypothetical protein
MSEDDNEREQREEEFQYWLAHMDDALEEFLAGLPRETAQKLDSSIESIDVVEKLLIDRYESYEAAKRSGDTRFFDGCARYVGETIRKHIGGKWNMVLDDKKNVHYGVPRIQGFTVPMSPMAPLHMCLAATDRRKGNYITGVIRNYYKGKGRSRKPGAP